MTLKSLKAKQSEDMQENILLIWKKKESKTMKKLKIIDLKSLNLLKLGIIELDQLIKFNKWQ